MKKFEKLRKFKNAANFEKFEFLNFWIGTFFSNVYFDKVGIDFEFWRSRKTVLIGPDPYLDLKNHKFSNFSHFL